MMAQDRRQETSAAEENSLRELEEILAEAADGGNADFLMTEELRKTARHPVSDDVTARVWHGIARQDLTRQRLRAVHRVQGSRSRAFPDLLQALREKAQVSTADVAAALRIDLAKLRRLESGELDVFSLTPEFLAAVMEVFSINYAQLSTSLKHLVARQAKASEMGVMAARTTNAAEGDLERAMHDVAGMLAEEDGDVASATVPARYLEAVRRVLERWGRDDLLG